MDSLPCERIYVTSSISYDEQMVVEGRGESLRSEPQGSSSHPLNLCIGPEGVPDEGIVLDSPFMQAFQVCFLCQKKIAQTPECATRQEQISEFRTRSLHVRDIRF